MTNQDASAGWDAVADRFAALRSDVGTDIVLRWSSQLPRGGAVLDIGCGTGMPISARLADKGFALFGIDPAPRMIAAFRRNLPGAGVACEPAETSSFFGRRFDGVVAIGVLFLLSEAAQAAVFARVGRVLHPGGHFLFSAPRERCAWEDSLTGRRSQSLGETAYGALLGSTGLKVVGCHLDRGNNHYFEAVAPEG
ncbi:class I SAM-dependent methyltransferase [Sphingomonas sp. TDK1]|uniref:class I SAM-dependent methyltransferase n=1 Tax=Sphingomonas sp. TDK1 TaxID=453247 RepID=UPI0007D9BDC4|nr:class I SAM-dependent methyltransferase [Sphingomonas sp. TDK1]OAN67191.1 methyltransferase [Sphingomonas sp. TDK1]